MRCDADQRVPEARKRTHIAQDQISLCQLLQKIFGSQCVIQLKLEVLDLCFGIGQLGLGQLKTRLRIAVCAQFLLEIGHFGFAFFLILGGDIA